MRFLRGMKVLNTSHFFVQEILAKVKNGCIYLDYFQPFSIQKMWFIIPTIDAKWIAAHQVPKICETSEDMAVYMGNDRFKAFFWSCTLPKTNIGPATLGLVQMSFLLVFGLLPGAKLVFEECILGGSSQLLNG